MNVRFLLNCSLIGCSIALATGSIDFNQPNWANAPARSAALTIQSGSSLQIAQAASLSGSWKLLNMTAGDSPMPMLPLSDRPPTVDFTSGRITGSGGCNRFMGGYEVQGEQLTVSPLASTFMACEEGVMTQETRYLAALQGAQRYEIDRDGYLAVFYQTEEGSGVLRFASQTVRGLW